MNILFCAPHFGMVPQTLPLQLTQPRHPYGTQELLLSAATFLSWHGSQIPVAWDPNVNATYKGQLHRRQTSDWHHPCCSGLQVQGTAISPAAHFWLYRQEAVLSIVNHYSKTCYWERRLLFTHHYSARCFGMNMPKSRDIQAKIPLPQAIWNEFWLCYWERSEQ